MKKIIIMVVISLFLVSLVNGLEQTSKFETTPEPETMEKQLSFLERIFSFMTSGTIVVSEPTGGIGKCDNFPTGGLNVFSKKYPQTEIIGVGKKCSDNSLVRIFECHDGQTCNNILKAAEAYKIKGIRPRFTEWNSDKYYAYKCYNCEVSTLPVTGELSICDDSDGGYSSPDDYYHKGTTTRTTEKGKSSGIDTCMSSTRVQEWYCSSGIVSAKYYECPYGCSEGACSSTPSGYCSSPFGSNGDYDCVGGVIKKCSNDKWATYQTCESGKCLYENVLSTSPSNLCMPKDITSNDCPNYNLKNSETKCEGVSKIKCIDGKISIIGSCQVDIGETCTTNSICKTGYCNPTTKKCEVEPEIKEEIEEGKICCRGAGFGLDENNQLAFEWQYKLLDKCEAPFVTEVDNGYCSGEKEAEPLPEVDEETEEGAPEEPEGTIDCSIGLGGYCKPDNQAGLDDSSPNNLCKTGWCQDVSGVGGRCAKVGTFSDGKTKRGYEPHPTCVITAEEYKTDWCAWTNWAPKIFGQSQCNSAYMIIIGGFIILMIFLNIMPKK